jgi:hypothetical protein
LGDSDKIEADRKQVDDSRFGGVQVTISLTAEEGYEKSFAPSAGALALIKPLRLIPLLRRAGAATN